jgi:hypothetical protein
MDYAATLKVLTNGSLFYAAVSAQDKRWNDRFLANGTVPTLPNNDIRYADTAIALLTMYQTLDRGLIPQYVVVIRSFESGWFSRGMMVGGRVLL